MNLQSEVVTLQVFCISKSELQKLRSTTGNKVQQFPVADLTDILPPTESLVRKNLSP